MADEGNAGVNPGRARVWRTLLMIGAATAALFFIAFGAFAWLLPTDVIARAGEARAEAALGMEVSVGALGIDFLPVPAVALDSVRIGGGDSSLVRIARVRLEPRILPLLSGRVIVDEVIFERPRLRVRVDRAGNSNLPTPSADDAIHAAAAVSRAKRAAANAEDATGTSADAPVAFMIREFRVDDGRFTYRSLRAGSVLALLGVDQRLRIQGEFQDGRLSRIRVAGALAADSAVLRSSGGPWPVRGMPVRIEHDAVLDLSRDHLIMHNLHVELARLALEGEGRVEAVSDPERRVVALGFRTDTFDISNIVQSLPSGLFRGQSADGARAPGAAGSAMSVDGRGFARVRVRGPATGDSMPQVDGVLRLAEVSTDLDGETFAAGLGGRIRFSLDSARTSGIEGRLLGDPVRLTFSAGGLTGAGVPSVRFEVHAGSLDLDALLGPSGTGYPTVLFARLADRTIQGRSAATIAQELDLAPPSLPEIRARGTITADRIVRNGMVYDDVVAAIQLTPERASMRNARFGFMGGTVELSVTYEPAENGAGLRVDYSLVDVGAEPFFARLTPLRQHIGGMLRLAGSVRARLDSRMLPIRQTLRASGRAALLEGRLVNWPLLRAIGERLALARFDTLAFDDWTGTFTIEGPRVVMHRTNLQTNEMTAAVGGWFNWSGELNFRATVQMPGRIAAGAAPVLRRVAAAASGGDGMIPVDIRVTGTLGDPEVGLDLSEAQSAIIRSAREAVGREAGELADRALDEVTDRVALDSLAVSLDSVPVQIDSLIPPAVGDSLADAAGALADSIAGRLGDVIPFLGPPAAAADSAGGLDQPAPDSAVTDSAAADTASTDTMKAGRPDTATGDSSGAAKHD